MDSSNGSLNHLPRAIAFVDKTEGGGSGAVLLSFEDGVKRVTKLLGNGQDGNGPVQFVLVNELVVARLAAILDAPCPNGRAVWVDEPYVDQARHEVSNLTQARPGPAFGRAWVEGTFSPSADTCREALNRSALAGLIVLYTWTWNTDFKSDHLAVRQADNGGVEVLGLDHGHCFNNNWSDEIREHVPEVLPCNPLDLVVTYRDLQPYLDNLIGLSAGDVMTATSSIPIAWGVGDQARSDVHSPRSWRSKTSRSGTPSCTLMTLGE